MFHYTRQNGSLIAIASPVTWTMVAVATALLAGCGDKAAEPLQTTTQTSSVSTSTASATTTKKAVVETATCKQAGEIVNSYDILAEGASRAEYLSLLHHLQANCGYTAKRLGLTGDVLKKCRADGWEQENCTMFDPRLWKGS